MPVKYLQLFKLERLFGDELFFLKIATFGDTVLFCSGVLCLNKADRYIMVNSGDCNPQAAAGPREPERS